MTVIDRPPPSLFPTLTIHEFARDIAITDTNRDGFGDLIAGLVMSYPGRDPADVPQFASVVYRGSTNGVRTTQSQVLRDAGGGLAGGDINGDGYGDLLAGSVFALFATATEQGWVSVFLGSPTGLRKVWKFNEGTPGIPGEKSGLLGAAVSLGDINGDGKADAAIGAPLEGPGNAWGYGAVTVLFGSSAATGLTTSGARLFGAGSLGGVTYRASFGSSLAP